MSNWAVVIGVDEYGDDALELSGAVRDAELFRAWVREENGGPVPEENLRFLPARTDGGDPGDGVPTKDNIVAAINDILERSGGAGEAFYFFFAGHGLTAWVSKREEGAILTPGFDKEHPEHSLAIRSVLEYFETVQFADQFFFIDACRNAPKQDFEIGRWPIPRRRDPGKPPVQQFVLYATSPGLTAAQDTWEGIGEFTKVLKEGLFEGYAKAWSWDRNCYEVRWEKLATYIKDAMEAAKVATKPGHTPPPEGWPIQVPQDTGSRGVEGRQRDALLASIPRASVDPLELTIKLEADPRYDEAEVSVLDAVAAPVASALKVTGDSHVFTLPPKTYAVLVRTKDKRVGRVEAPIELYDKPLTKVVGLEPDEPAEGDVSEQVGPGEPRQGNRPGTIIVKAVDPLTVVELRDEAGEVLDAKKVEGKTGTASFEQPPGFYRVRLIGPEGPGEEQFVVLDSGGEAVPDKLEPTQVSDRTIELAEAAGGRYDAEHPRDRLSRQGGVARVGRSLHDHGRGTRSGADRRGRELLDRSTCRDGQGREVRCRLVRCRLGRPAGRDTGPGVAGRHGDPSQARAARDLGRRDRLLGDPRGARASLGVLRARRRSHRPLASGPRRPAGDRDRPVQRGAAARLPVPSADRSGRFVDPRPVETRRAPATAAARWADRRCARPRHESGGRCSRGSVRRCARRLRAAPHRSLRRALGSRRRNRLRRAAFERPVHPARRARCTRPRTRTSQRETRPSPRR